MAASLVILISLAMLQSPGDTEKHGRDLTKQPSIPELVGHWIH